MNNLLQGAGLIELSEFLPPHIENSVVREVKKAHTEL